MSSGEPAGFSALAVDHARNPRHMGRLTEFDGHAGVTGTCGDSMDMWIRVEDGFVVEVGFHTDGCGSSVACGSMAAELARSRHLAAVPLFRPRDLLDAFGEFPEESAHCADLAIDALRAACDDYFRAAPSRSAIRLLLLSGNGGTGKSTLAVSLARNFATRGTAVGILDADLDCPAIPDLLGATENDITGVGIPMGNRDGIRFCSIGPLSGPGRPPLLLRGTRRSLLARRMVREVDWGPIDLMLIDTAPGTGDEIQAVARSAGRIHGAILVGREDRASERGLLLSLIHI